MISCNYILSMYVLMTVKFTWETIINKSISQWILFSSRTFSFAKLNFRRWEIVVRFKKHKMPKAVAVNMKWGKGRKKEDERKLSFHLDEILIRCKVEEWRNWSEFWTALMLNDSCCFKYSALYLFSGCLWSFRKKQINRNSRIVFPSWSFLRMLCGSTSRHIMVLSGNKSTLSAPTHPNSFSRQKKRFPIRIFCWS